MLFNALVDLVMLWNVLGRLQDYEDWGEDQEEALRILVESGLTLDLMMRVLMVIGMPLEECQGLSQKQAAALLHEKLVELRPSSYNASRHDSGHDGGETLRGVAECSEGSLDINATPEQLESIAMANRVAARSAHAEPSHLYAKVPQPAAIGRPRELKFEELDADLADFLDQMDVPLTSCPITPPAAAGISREAKPATPDAAAAAKDTLLMPRPMTPPAGSGPAREAKFAALDADLAACVGGHMSEALEEQRRSQIQDSPGGLPTLVEDEREVVSPFTPKAAQGAAR